MKAPSFNDPMHFLGITEDLVGVEDILRDRTETVLHVAVGEHPTSPTQESLTEATHSSIVREPSYTNARRQE